MKEDVNLGAVIRRLASVGIRVSGNRVYYKGKELEVKVKESKEHEKVVPFNEGRGSLRYLARRLGDIDSRSNPNHDESYYLSVLLGEPGRARGNDYGLEHVNVIILVLLVFGYLSLIFSDATITGGVVVENVSKVVNPFLVFAFIFVILAVFMMVRIRK